MPDEHSQEVYDQAVKNFKSWQEKGWLVQDSKPCYYIYAQTMNCKTQYGLVLCAHTDDYSEGKIKNGNTLRASLNMISRLKTDSGIISG